MKNVLFIGRGVPPTDCPTDNCIIMKITDELFLKTRTFQNVFGDARMMGMSVYIITILDLSKNMYVMNNIHVIIAEREFVDVMKTGVSNSPRFFIL